MQRADLHMHTTASDGTYTPEALVRAAKAKGLAAIAITDHDVTDGVEEGMRFGADIGLEVLAGVEINTDHGDTEIHVLGYAMDLSNPQMVETMDWLREGRMERARKMVEKLNALGYPLSWERVLEIAGPGAIGRPHIADALVEAGHVVSRKDAFARFLGNDGPAYAARARFDATDAIRLIRGAGGVPVVAHPAKIHDDSLIPGLVGAGLGGLEAYHSEHTPEQAEHYVRLANDLGLLWTGGSDFHGSMESRPLAGVTVPYTQVEALKAAAKR
jgi:predicted metal-dependent phosphoesterase TrpH